MTWHKNTCTYIPRGANGRLIVNISTFEKLPRDADTLPYLLDLTLLRVLSTRCTLEPQLPLNAVALEYAPNVLYVISVALAMTVHRPYFRCKEIGRQSDRSVHLCWSEIHMQIYLAYNRN